MNKRLFVLLVLAASIEACQRPAETPKEVEGLSLTAWGQHYEIFAEADQLMAGQVSKSHTHITVLNGFLPLKQGVVSAILRDDRGEEQTFQQDKALRDGIFSIEIGPKRAGVFDLLFRVEGPSGEETIPSGRVQIGEGDSLGRLIEAPHYGPAGASSTEPIDGEPISFLKEQQWRTEFATSWAIEGSIHRGVRGPARVRAAAGGEALLTAPLDGVVASTTRAFVGMDVARGSPVVHLTSRVGSDRSLEQIRSELELAEARLNRLEELLKVEAVSQSEVEQASARVKALKAELRAIRGEGPQVEVRSPIEGQIAEILVVPGQGVTAGTPLARVVRTRPLWVEVALSPSEAGALARGAAGLVLHPSGGQRPVSVSAQDVRLVSRAPEVHQSTGSVGIILEVRSEIPVRPGTVVDAEVLLFDEVHGIVVPASAIIDDGGVPVIYVQVEGESFIRQEVRTLATQGENVLVENLPAGCRIVARGGGAIRRAALLRSGPPEGHVH